MIRQFIFYINVIFIDTSNKYYLNFQIVPCGVSSKEIPFLGKMSSWKEYNLGANTKGIDLEQALKSSVPSIRYPL